MKKESEVYADLLNVLREFVGGFFFGCGLRLGFLDSWIPGWDVGIEGFRDYEIRVQAETISLVSPETERIFQKFPLVAEI